MLLIVGVLFLLKDLNMWTFWGLSWWTVLFIVLGICKIGMSKCHDCQAMCGPSGKKR
jgi:predicted secreted protein